MMGQFVTERDIDYWEIIRRGRANGGDEDFAFLQCPGCGHIYLIDSEIDTAYLDADDLSRRNGFFSSGDVVYCIGCGRALLSEQIWAALRGDAYTDTPGWQVDWEQFQQSPWAWAGKPAPVARP